MQAKITCPKCGFEQQAGLTTHEPSAGQAGAECLKCGIVFAKYNPDRNAMSDRQANTQTVPLHVHGSSEESESAELLDATDRWIYGTGKYTIIGVMALFFFYMVLKRSSWCFLDYVNLPFHESGHLIFSPFGETISFLGGTFGQLMWPAVLMVYFIIKKEPLGSSFCLFWLGENFLNISKYIADARSMLLPLVGGSIHDWNFLLEKWGLLNYDGALANVIFFMGVIIMTSAMVWAFLAKPGKPASQ